MATAFSTIFDSFLGKIADPDILCIEESGRTDFLKHLLYSAQSKFRRICKTDLSLADSMLMEYTNDLTLEEIDILSDGMVWAWYNTKLNHSDLLSNFLSTRDYSLAAAPSNMLKEVRNTRDEAWVQFRCAMNTYSYADSNVETLKPGGV